MSVPNLEKIYFGDKIIDKVYGFDRTLYTATQPVPLPPSYTVNFEGTGETDGSYNATNVTLNGIQWTIGPQALIGNTATDIKNGARAARLRLDSGVFGSITMNADKSDGIGTITFLYARSNFSGDRTGVSPTFIVEYSTNQGSSWTSVGSTVDLSGVDNLTTYSQVVNITGSARIRIVQNGGDSGKRWNVDDIEITSFV